MSRLRNVCDGTRLWCNGIGVCEQGWKAQSRGILLEEYYLRAAAVEGLRCVKVEGL